MMLKSSAYFVDEAMTFCLKYLPVMPKAASLSLNELTPTTRVPLTVLSLRAAAKTFA
jgi:hypothetical protein